MGQNLGELGTKRAPVDITFGWFGEQMRVGPGAGDLSLIDFLEFAETIDEENVVAAMRATKTFLRQQIHADDWPRLIELAQQNGQQFSDLMNLAKAIVEAVAKFPTRQPSVSSSGRAAIAPKSRAGSSSTAGEALTMLDGRPDLKMAVWQAHMAEMEEMAAAG